MSSIPSNVQAFVTVAADSWHRFRTAQAEANAAKRKADLLRKETGLPETADLVSLLSLAPSDSGQITVLDGNGKAVGKVAVFWRDAYTVEAGFVSRVS